MKNFKYFKYGYPSDIKLPVYGLYQPGLDCFLSIVDNLDVANKLKFLLSSRYNLFVCEVSRAKNYMPTIIDNEICENWALSNRYDIDFSQFYLSTSPISVDELVDSQTKFVFDLEKEKKWILMCEHWVRYIEHLKLQSYYMIENQISSILKVNEITPVAHSNITPIENQIMKLLYLGNDLSEIDFKILQLVKTQDSTFFDRARL